MVGGFSVATARRKASQPPDRMPHRQSRRKRIASSKRGHLMFAQKPGRHHECGNQPARKNSPRLQSVQAKNLPQIFTKGMSTAPFEDDVKKLRAYDSCQHHGNSKVPG